MSVTAMRTVVAAATMVAMTTSMDEEVITARTVAVIEDRIMDLTVVHTVDPIAVDTVLRADTVPTTGTIPMITTL